MSLARWLRLPSWTAIWLPVLLALAGCIDTGTTATATGAVAPPPAIPAAAPTALLEDGRKIYNFRCYFCHGYSGDARTLAATYLSPVPRDFTRGVPLSRTQILQALRAGRAGTAMKSFDGILDAGQMEAVAAFVEAEFVRDKARNTVYHSAQNGWPDHQRFASAFPFATGTIKLDAPLEALDQDQLRGRRLFLSACVSCHDRAHVDDAGPAWSARPLSYPRMGFAPGQGNPPPVDAVSSASVYAKHEVAPRALALTARERRGEKLFQANCAFCHGADGTGRNWIGQFMEPKARDLTTFNAQSMPAARLRVTLREGLPGTSMPAWKDVLSAPEMDAIGAYLARAIFTRPGSVARSDG